MATRSKAKALARAESKDRRPKAIAKYIRISPSKVQIVLDLIRGKDYKDAVAILKTTAKAASEPVLKCMNSAAANAEVTRILFTLQSVLRTKVRRSKECNPYLAVGDIAF